MMYRGKRYLIIDTAYKDTTWLIENNIPYRTIDEVPDNLRIIEGDELLSAYYQQFLRDSEDMGIYIGEGNTTIKEIVQIFINNEVMIDQYKIQQVPKYEVLEEIKENIPETNQVDLTKANHIMIVAMVGIVILFSSFIIKARRRDKRRFFDDH
ncbi:MAG: hypothetical protein E6370_10155 [Clostridiales bacterium]|nr:hypothetical protein [Clostridiales bacterium]MDU6974678.1 hypothetical protein [Clostridiales bacterium]